MISTAHAQLMARYNSWQNLSLYGAASRLSDAQRCDPRGAFFGSLHTTLAHILWADRVWMNRFAHTLATSSEDDQGRGPAYQDWMALQSARIEFDATIISWTSKLSDSWLAADFTWSNVAGTRKTTQPAWRLVTHFFNHQTHHRGQAHAILTGFGIMPDDTDLFLMPPES
jgi:uncharacterized damage-inducible protein DinB